MPGPGRPGPEVGESPPAIRLRSTKLGKIRFTSQRDAARMWERALRRSGMPIAWSEGFSPRPLLSFGLALPTGCESLAEYLDIRLVPKEDPGSGPFPGIGDPVATAADLTALLPHGMTVTGVGRPPDGAGSLQQEVTCCTWRLEVLGVAAEELTERIGHLLDAPSVPLRRERKGRMVEDDLRPSVRALVQMEGPVDGPQDGLAPSGWPLRMHAELATQPRGVRPKELLQGLGADLVLVRACRTHQWIERDGARWEPLPAGGGAPGATAPHAQERAS